MATRDRLHILVPSAASSEAFSPLVLGRSGASPPSPADRGAHGRRLKDDLDALGAAARARREQTDVRVEGAVEGVYIQFESVPGFDLELTALEPRQGKVHPELRSVTERLVDGQPVQFATVFVPDGWIGRFSRKFEQYVSETTPKGHPRHRALVERIANLRAATLRALWTDDLNQFPEPDDVVWWELWLRRRDGAEERLAAFVEQNAFRLGSRRLVFEDRVVVLAQASPNQLGGSLDLLDDLAELRRPADPMQFLADMAASDQAAFVRDLAGRVSPPDAAAPTTGSDTAPRWPDLPCMAMWEQHLSRAECIESTAGSNRSRSSRTPDPTTRTFTALSPPRRPARWRSRIRSAAEHSRWR